MVEWRAHDRVFTGVALRQREWDRANSDKQKQIEPASDKMRFDRRVNLLFHMMFILVDFSVSGTATSYCCNESPTFFNHARPKMSRLI